MIASKSLAAFVALVSTPLVFGQYYPAGNATTAYAPTATASGSPSATQTVTVGQNGLTFTPDTILASAGSEIVFQFYPKNHSVVQADFNNPCNPSNNAIFSGFFPTSSGPSDEVFSIKVTDDNPIWLYCSQNNPSPHCAAGMVAVINPPTSGPNTLDNFRNAAKGTKTSTSPSTPNGGEVSSSKPSPSGTSTGNPSQHTGAASSLFVGAGVVGGAVAAFAAFML